MEWKRSEALPNDGAFLARYFFLNFIVLERAASHAAARYFMSYLQRETLHGPFTVKLRWPLVSRKSIESQIKLNIVTRMFP